MLLTISFNNYHVNFDVLFSIQLQDAAVPQVKMALVFLARLCILDRGY